MNNNSTKNIVGFLATGKLGSLIMESFLKKNHNTIIISRNKNQDKLKNLKQLGAKIYEYTPNNICKLDNIINENSSIYIGNIYQTEINREIINLINNSKQKIKKIIFISGANTKKISEGYGELEKFEKEIISSLPQSTIVKPTMIFGLKGDNNLEKIVKWLKKFPIFPIIGNGKTLYQPVHYFDLRDAIIKIFETEKLEGKKIIIGGNESIEYQKIIQIIRQKINSKNIVIKLPQYMVYIFSKIIIKIFNVKLPLEQIQKSHIDRNVDNSEAINLIEYNPKSFEIRIEESLKEYYKL